MFVCLLMLGVCFVVWVCFVHVFPGMYFFFNFIDIVEIVIMFCSYHDALHAMFLFHSCFVHHVLIMCCHNSYNCELQQLSDFCI